MKLTTAKPLESPLPQHMPAAGVSPYGPEVSMPPALLAEEKAGGNTSENSKPAARQSSEKATALIHGILRILVGGAFVFAGVLKIADPAKFAADIGNYRLAPHVLINAIAIFLPWIEAIAGLFVLAGIWLRAASLIILILTATFLGVIVSALARGLNIECGCFGTVGGRHVGWVNLAMDAALLCLAALLFRRCKNF